MLLSEALIIPDPPAVTVWSSEFRSGPAGLLRNVPVGSRGVSSPVICSASLTRLKI